jgi:2-polyprenyl-6-methoxyphenol hydroxylase-like FAD-dependent oxidoreductase
MTPGFRDRVVPVLVVGAGPAGLTAAVMLARQGIDVLVVERRPEGSELPRATVLSVRAMELLRSWGLEQRILAGGVDVEMSMYEMPNAARATEGSRIEVGYPTAEQAAIVSPTAPACVPQDHLESVLLDHLASLPSVTVERGTEAVDVNTTADDVAVSLRDVGGDVRRTVTAEFVVAADGARSRIRSSLDIELVGPDAVIEGVQAEFHAPDLWRALDSYRYGVYAISDPEAAGTLLPAGQDDRWLFGTEIDQDETGDSSSVLDTLHRRIERAAGMPGIPIRVDRYNWFSAAAKLATRFSSGRVHLVGDAAHRITPRGGTGLNTAIGDGRDIGWRLAWVLRGWAPPSFLAGYEGERRPVAIHNMERSADPGGTRRLAATELQVDLGGRVPHVWVDGTERSTLDLLGPGLTLFHGPAARPHPGASSSGAPVTPVALGVMAARAFGLGRAGAALVRPDGILVAAWGHETPSELDVSRAASSLVDSYEDDSLRDPRSAA